MFICFHFYRCYIVQLVSLEALKIHSWSFVFWLSQIISFNVTCLEESYIWLLINSDTCSISDWHFKVHGLIWSHCFYLNYYFCRTCALLSHVNSFSSCIKAFCNMGHCTQCATGGFCHFHWYDQNYTQWDASYLQVTFICTGQSKCIGCIVNDWSQKLDHHCIGFLSAS